MYFAKYSIFLLCICKLCVASIHPILNGEWDEFKLKYKKFYATKTEEQKRMEIWRKNYYFVKENNGGFKVKLNKFADLLTEEIVNMKNKIKLQPIEMSIESSLNLNIPSNFDWRERGVVGPVRDQGSIGDPNAIVAEEVVQSLYAIQTGRLVELSVTQIEDCCPQYGDVFGCIQNSTHGLCTESDYPPGVLECKHDCKPLAVLKGRHIVPQGDENDLQVSVLNGTLMVGVDASDSSFQFYESGVYSSTRCSKYEIDHVLQLVGYGKTVDGTDYWICRNSWGIGWGMRGYILIERGKNMCGIASYATLPY